MSIIKDTFFGGAEKKAAKSQQQGIERGIQATEKGVREAKEAAIPLFGQARQDLQQGFQGALDVFGQSLPAQVQAFQGGNVGAQEQLLSGLIQAVDVLKDVKGIGFVELDEKDVVRHPLVKDIIKAYKKLNDQ